ncbi:hypothetical protein HMPREF9093_00577 [Fusobacterium sp. oral taxon 370 str. F0437]|nr:hypothetical protein HMPREF9093_00577 [Fusobacterium sp. oral taxon 370 str. F0437]
MSQLFLLKNGINRNFFDQHHLLYNLFINFFEEDMNYKKDRKK